MEEGEGGGRRGSEKGREREREREGTTEEQGKLLFYLIDSQVDACVGYDSHQTRSESSIKSSASLVSYDLPEAVSHTSVLAGFSQGKSSLQYLTHRMEKACWSSPSNQRFYNRQITSYGRGVADHGVGQHNVHNIIIMLAGYLIDILSGAE